MTRAIVLASASPRRRALLEAAGLAFDVEPSGADEGAVGSLVPDELAVTLARRKAREVADRHRDERRFVVGADTVVALEAPGGWRLLGKPVGEGEARGMLEALSGTRHAVVTGVCVLVSDSGAERAEAETTWVTMRAIEPEEVAAYVASGEWRDKAGGYAIQENADEFVVRLEGGGHDNVVGLPVERTLRLLRESGAPVAPPG